MATSEVHYIARSFTQALNAMEMSHKINGPQHGIFRAMHRRLWACKPRATQSRPRPLGRLNTERLRHVGAVVMQTSLTAAYNVYQWPANPERRNSGLRPALPKQRRLPKDRFRPAFPEQRIACLRLLRLRLLRLLQ